MRIALLLKAHGCMILEILHRSSACGLPAASNAILRLVKGNALDFE